VLSSLLYSVSYLVLIFFSLRFIWLGIYLFRSVFFSSLLCYFVRYLFRSFFRYFVSLFFFSLFV